MKRKQSPSLAKVTAPSLASAPKGQAIKALFARIHAVLSVGLLPLLLGGIFLSQLPILRKLGERSLCYADWEGFQEALSAAVPGGVLQWCASFCAVLFHQPLLGAAVFIGLCVGVFALGRYWMRLSRWVALIPIIQVLLQVVYCGFSAWIFMNAAFAQAYLLQWAVALFCAGTIRRYGAWGLLTAALYPWAGISVLFGVIGGACARQLRWWVRVLAVVVAAGGVFAWKLFTYADPSWTTLFLGQQWILCEEGARIWDVVSIVSLVGVFASDALYPWVMRLLAWRSWIAKAMPYGLASGVLLVAMLFADPSILYSILACERNLRYGDGQYALQLSEDEVIDHRMLSAYYIHSIWRAGKLEDKLFDMPWKVSHTSTTIDTMSLDGHWLLYHYGIVQMARRWCYENVIKLGWNGDHYALLTKVALVCNEMPLARRYALQLKRIPLRTAEAAEYLRYIDGELVPQNHELRRVAELHLRLCADEGSPIFEAGKRLEEGIYNRYAVLKNGNRDMVALYLCSSLLLRDTTALTENFDVILQVWPQRPLPRVFQQGLLAAAAALPPNEQPRLTQDLFTPGMFEAFQAFQRESKTADPANERFRARFGKSYWYYASFLP